MIQAIPRSLPIVVHTIGVLVAAVAAVLDIGTVVAFGPFVALTGILVAVLSYRERCRIGFGFGLTGTAAVVAWFLIIFGLGWSPRTAHFPVSFFLIAFALAGIPGGVFCILEALPGCQSPQTVSVQHRHDALHHVSCGLVSRHSACA